MKIPTNRENIEGKIFGRYDYDGLHPFMVVEQDEDNPSETVCDENGNVLFEDFESFVRACKQEIVLPIDHCDITLFDEHRIANSIEPIIMQEIIKKYILYSIEEAMHILRNICVYNDVVFKYYTQGCSKAKLDKERNKILRRFSEDIKPHLSKYGLSMLTEDLDNSNIWSDATVSWCKVLISNKLK